jgi:tRNA (mo5U34)-methyltransferase
VMGEPVDQPFGPWQTIQRLIPDDLSGMTVLDVGCNAGFYSFEAKRRGAARVLGVDGQRQHIRQGLLVRKVLGLAVEFRRLNVYELNARNVGQFDITLALGLLYHLKHPILALENLYQVTKELLIIETAIMPPERTPESFVHPLGHKQMLLHSIALVENATNAKEQVFNWFLPGVEALKGLLRTTGFVDVEVISVREERAVVVCRKAKGEAIASAALKHFVAELSLEAGPSSCRASSEMTFQLRVENVGLAHWPTSGASAGEQGVVFLGSHLLRDTEEEVDWDYGRARLPRDLEPGETARLELKVRAPENPGSYIVEFDMVAEHVTWFEDHGSGTLRHELVVK